MKEEMKIITNEESLKDVYEHIGSYPLLAIFNVYDKFVNYVIDNNVGIIVSLANSYNEFSINNDYYHGVREFIESIPIECENFKRKKDAYMNLDELFEQIRILLRNCESDKTTVLPVEVGKDDVVEKEIGSTGDNMFILVEELNTFKEDEILKFYTKIDSIRNLLNAANINIVLI